MVSKPIQSYEEIVTVMCTGCDVTNHRSDCCASRGNGDCSGMKTMGLHRLQRWSDSSEVHEEEAQRKATTVSADTKRNSGFDNCNQADYSNM
jgi:hypothetical protein